ncbi:MAG: CehA/McbA family metallohydrolase, partial [Anaerolineales bacterium]|nr:CehA/McbA family metallohydrolase [Anaerolineales bacterium]
LELDRVLDWRAQGWVTADTHVHFLTPQTALLEGSAEGVNVVNLLASQWGEMFSNVSDFDGRTTLGAKEFGGDGEFLVRVGTENRMQVLGHISLLGYSGRMIHPLCTGGPSESALGDPQEVTMADWAQRCLDQNGLVIMPHGPNPQCERAADIVLGLVDGIEMMTFNPHDWQINPYGIADWYRYLNLGYQVPVVGGSDKMAASMLLGGVRTYAHLGDRPFSYDNWMAAVRAGNTFVTVGPLLELSVAGQAPGSTLRLPAGGGHLDINWRVESVRLPIEQIEVIVGGLVVEQINVDGALRHEGHTQVNITGSTWIGLRVRGSYRGIPDEIAAHSSAVQILVDGQELFAQADAIAVLEQIEGAIAYVDTLATRPAAQRYKQLRLTLESAYNRLHQRLHQQGLFHHHLLPNNHHES